MTSDLIDNETLDAELAAICEAHPTWVNPTDRYGTGLYKNGEGHRCLIGQYAFSKGWKLEDDESIMSAASVIADVSNWPIIDPSQLDLWQVLSDHHGGRPWGEVPSALTDEEFS